MPLMGLWLRGGSFDDTSRRVLRLLRRAIRKNEANLAGQVACLLFSSVFGNKIPLQLEK